MDQPQLMIYGATGYTGRLVVAEAIAQGLHPVLAGRDARKLAAIPGVLGLERRAVALDDADALASALDDVTVVTHCAGPFSHTAERMLEACLASGTHYVDITGEAAVLEALASRDTEAKQTGIMVFAGRRFRRSAKRLPDCRIWLRAILAVDGYGLPWRRGAAFRMARCARYSKILERFPFAATAKSFGSRPAAFAMNSILRTERMPPLSAVGAM